MKPSLVKSSIKPIGTHVKHLALGDVEIIVMSSAQWVSVPDCFCQRNTEAHAPTVERALQAFQEEHRLVNAARLPDGSLMKLNGHTRGLLWASGRVRSPESVIVFVTPAASLTEVEAKYYTFDNMAAVETKTDLIFGGCRKHGIQFNSAYLKSGRFAAGMTPVTPRHVPVAERAQFWRQEFEALDVMSVNGPNRDVFINPILSIYLMTFRKYGLTTIDFWRAFNERAGSKIEGRYEAPESLVKWLDLQKAAGWGNGESQKRIRNTALAVFEAWYANRSIRFSIAEIKKLDRTYSLCATKYRTELKLDKVVAK